VGVVHGTSAAAPLPSLPSRLCAKASHQWASACAPSGQSHGFKKSGEPAIMGAPREHQSGEAPTA
jgi:hypothetical protein